MISFGNPNGTFVSKDLALLNLTMFCVIFWKYVQLRLCSRICLPLLARMLAATSSKHKPKAAQFSTLGWHKSAHQIRQTHSGNITRFDMFLYGRQSGIQSSSLVNLHIWEAILYIFCSSQNAFGMGTDTLIHVHCICLATTLCQVHFMRMLSKRISAYACSKQRRAQFYIFRTFPYVTSVGNHCHQHTGNCNVHLCFCSQVSFYSSGIG
jgi:hypothetical protein